MEFAWLSTQQIKRIFVGPGAIGLTTSILESLNLEKSARISSDELAKFLRNGPARPIIDRLVRTVAEVAKVEFVSLGLRSENKYHFIASQGFPFTEEFDSVPMGKLQKSLFAVAIEVPDLSKEPNFKTLASVPIGESWRYGANVPISLSFELADGGVLALSIADNKTRPHTGPTLIKLSQMACHFADVVWLSVQIRSSISQTGKTAAAARVLMDGLRQTMAPIALIDKSFKFIEFSPALKELQANNLGIDPKVGQSLFETWVDKESEPAVRSAMKVGKPATNIVSYPINSDRPISFDFHVLNFNESKLNFGVFSIRANSVYEFELGVKESNSSPYLYSINEPEGPDVLSDFLFDTLRIQKRLLQRKGFNYLALRTWRKPIKNYQISAVKALKRNPPESFVERIAIEMRAAVEAVHGNLDGAVVVPVPCGHSGARCLSERIAGTLASLTGIKLVNAFETVPLGGSSHPRTNAKRPRMKLVEAPKGQVILVDDIATSGAHIEEAMKLLSESAKGVWSITWIAG